MEEGRDDVAEADGQHLLVGSNRVAVFLGKHLGQRNGEGEAGRQTMTPGCDHQATELLLPCNNTVITHLMTARGMASSATRGIRLKLGTWGGMKPVGMCPDTLEL